MSELRDPQRIDGPSRKTLAKAALWTFVGAVVVTVLFILPAEYGVDPTGIGNRLGLTRLSGVSAPEIDSAPRVVEGTWPPAPADRNGNPSGMPASPQQSPAAAPIHAMSG